MERSEYWILDAVVQGMWLLSTLRENVVEEAFNRVGHGLSDKHLLQILDKLFQRGDIFAYRVKDLTTGDGERFVPNSHEIATFFPEPDWVWYGLTAQGGELWESLSNPSWDLFVRGELDTNTGECEAASGSLRLINDYLSGKKVSERIVQDSMEWDTIHNWQATYWRTIPIGYSVTFHITQPEIDIPIAEPVNGWYTFPVLT